MPRYTTAKGNKIEIGRSSLKYKRIIPLEEVAKSEHYDDMAELAVIFNHNIIEDQQGVWRWKANSLTCLLFDYAPFYTPSQAEENADGGIGFSRNSNRMRGSIDLNELAIDTHHKLFTVEEKMKFMMQSGYSLNGFAELFGQHEASEFDLPGARTEHEEGQDPENYIETIIDYMRRVHKDTVLKI
jgi:hypothetical protein